MMKKILAVAFLLLFIPVGVQSGTITDTPPYREYAENFDALLIGSTPTDSWYAVTSSGSGTQLVQTAPAGMTGRAWKVTDVGIPYASMMDNSGDGVGLCAPQTFAFAGQIQEALGVGTTWEYRLQAGAVSSGSAPINSLGIRFTGAIGAATVNYFIHGNALAAVNVGSGTLANGNTFTLLFSQVNCAGTASARFTQTGITGMAATMDVTATAGDPFIGDVNGLVIANTAGATGTTAWVDNYKWNGAPIPAVEEPVLQDTTNCSGIYFAETFESFLVGAQPDKCWYDTNTEAAVVDSPAYGSRAHKITTASAGPRAQYSFPVAPDLCVNPPITLTVKFNHQAGELHIGMETFAGEPSPISGPSFFLSSAGAGQIFRLHLNRQGSANIANDNMLMTLTSNNWYEAALTPICHSGNVMIVLLTLTNLENDVEETAAVSDTHTGYSVALPFFKWGDDDNNSPAQFTIDDLELSGVPVLAAATVALPGVTGMDIRTVAGLGSVIARYDGGDLIKTFTPLTLDANVATPADSNCLNFFGVISRGPDEADPDGNHVAYLQCDTGADNNVVKAIHIRSPFLTEPDKGDCGPGGLDYCHQNLKNNDALDDIDDIQPTMAEISDLGAFPISYRGQPGNSEADTVLAFPFTRFGNGGFGGYANLQHNNAPDQDAVKLVNYGPASTTIDDMCRTWYGTKDYFGVAHQDVGFQMQRMWINDDGGPVVQITSESSIAPSPFGAPSAASCDGQWAHLAGVESGIGGRVGVWDWQCVTGGANPTCPGTVPNSVLWTLPVAPINRGVVFQATKNGPEEARVGSGAVFHYGAYIDNLQIVVWSGLGVETCRIAAPFSVQTDFRELRMDENAQNIWIAWAAGISRYNVVDCTTVEPVSEEGRIDASHADADPCPPDRADEWYCGDGQEDNNEPTPETADCNGNAIPDGNETTTCRPDGCSNPDANGDCAPITCEPETQDGCEIDTPGNQDDTARETAADNAIDFGAETGMGLGFKFFGVGVSETTCLLIGLLWVVMFVVFAVILATRGGHPALTGSVVVLGVATAYVLWCFLLWIILLILAVFLGIMIFMRRGSA